MTTKEADLKAKAILDAFNNISFPEVQIKQSAKRVSRSGSTPVYEYKGIRIVNSAGSRWGRGWIYVTDGETHYSTTLESAKSFIDLHRG